MASDSLSDAPAALIRTMEGHIAFWSPAMEQRYGFAAEEAVGQVSHQLLRTTSWQELDEIEAVLLDQKTWNGGLVHYRADGQPVVAANQWHLHHETSSRGAFVTELHADIVPGGTLLGFQLVDVLTTMAHELSQPLTAISSYISGAQRSLQPAWPDRPRLDRGLTEAATQLARTKEILGRLRALGENLRDPRLRQLQAGLTANIVQTERVVQKSREVIRETRTIVTETVLARQERQKARAPRRSVGETDATADQSAVARQNIKLLQYLLQRNANDRLDAQTQQTLKRLLADENARLATLDQPETATE